jgi:transposase
MERTATHVILTHAEYDALMEMIRKLEARVLELETRLNKNSSNSSKPPSSDGLRKAIKNNREQSERNQGAQHGHKGSTLKMADQADKYEYHKVRGTCECGENLETQTDRNVIRKQEFELPKKLIEVIEHQIEVIKCTCGKIHYAPCALKGNVQYGTKFKSLMVYLNQYQLIPFERLQEISEDCFGMRISDGTLDTSNQICYEQLAQTEEQIKQALLTSPVINNDETGIRCAGKTQWVHSTSTPSLTHYSIQEKRGNHGIDTIAILPHYTGISIHDRWASYDNYACTHGLCNAHLLRDLKYLHEELNCTWAQPMIALLAQANEAKKQSELDAHTIESIETRYIEIVQQGKKNEPEQKCSGKIKRGRVPKSKSQLLLDVFANRSEQVLLFMYNKQVPFDNNLAERDLRMMKLKQKISGCFRTRNGAEVFCRIRSYISSARKNGYHILHAIENALIGNPILFVPTEQ